MTCRWGVRAAVSAMVLTAAVGCSGAPAGQKQDEATPVPVLRTTVLAEIPHDPAAFTEGLESDGPALYESTGQVGQSQLRELDPTTGAVLRSVPLPPDAFGEGIAVVGNRIWQLTWHNGYAIDWDKATFTQLRQVRLDGDGWGLCFDGNRLVRSDGSDKLRFHDPESLAETGSLSVTYQGKSFTGLNELACMAGQLWANVVQTEQIARIDSATGKVTALVDASGLLDNARRQKAGELNGIADAGNGEFFLTGKYWPAMFRVRFG